MWPFSHKQSIAGAGLLRGWTDRHSHILPGVDDGEPTMAGALRALAWLEQQGVNNVWLTPHVMEDCPNTPDKLRGRFQELQEAAKRSGGLRPPSEQSKQAAKRGGGLRPPSECEPQAQSITLHLAAENMLDSLFYERFERREILPYGDHADQILVETSYYEPPLHLEDTLHEIYLAGYQPVLAHPERYMYMDQERYHTLHDQGVLFQLNITSLAGAYGTEARCRAIYLLDEGLYTYSGSDLHSLHAFQRATSVKALKTAVAATVPRQ